MHAYLRGDNGIELIASDATMGMKAGTGQLISLTLKGSDETLLRGYWDGLADGGVVQVRLGETPWGDLFGITTDKFGIEWMVGIGEEDPRMSA